MRFVAVLIGFALLVSMGACKEKKKATQTSVPATVAPIWTVVNPVNRISDELSREPLDYADLSNWACTSALSNDSCHTTEGAARVLTDATITYETYQEPVSQPIDCFYVYPTVNPDPLIGNVDDYKLVPNAVIQVQAARFSQACRVFAPYYRQAKAGSYITDGDASQRAFKNAFLDVAAAFEHYLKNWNDGRPFVVMGHSQGAQHIAYLLHLYFEIDGDVTDIPGYETAEKLREKLVVALPIGFNIYTAKGSTTGGSFSQIPMCGGFDETGCVISYRSYAERLPFGPSWLVAVLVDKAIAEDGWLHQPYSASYHELACVNPAFNSLPSRERAQDIVGLPVSDGDTRVLAGTFMPYAFNVTTSSFETGREYISFPGRYSATCRKDPFGDYYLALGFHEPYIFSLPPTDLRGDPFAVRTMVPFPLGLHLIDFNAPLDDLVLQVRHRTQAYADSVTNFSL